MMPSDAVRNSDGSFRHCEIAISDGKTAVIRRQILGGAVSRKLFLRLIDRYVLTALTAFLQHPIPLTTQSFSILTARTKVAPSDAVRCRQTLAAIEGAPFKSRSATEGAASKSPSTGVSGTLSTRSTRPPRRQPRIGGRVDMCGLRSTYVGTAMRREYYMNTI
jgi:hypothetical protein